MIGRTEPLKPFELIRWARQQAVDQHLRTLEAHVLLVLATYANRDGIAWPSIKTLALDSGLRPTKDGRNSAVSAALARLEELRLIWTVQGGHGHSARRELLFNPAAEPSVNQDGSSAQPSASADGSGRQPSGYADVQPSGLTDQNYQGNGHPQQPTATARGSLPATRKASPPGSRKGHRTAPRSMAAVIADLDLGEAA